MRRGLPTVMTALSIRTGSLGSRTTPAGARRADGSMRAGTTRTSVSPAGKSRKTKRPSSSVTATRPCGSTVTPFSGTGADDTVAPARFSSQKNTRPEIERIARTGTSTSVVVDGFTSISMGSDSAATQFNSLRTKHLAKWRLRTVL